MTIQERTEIQNRIVAMEKEMAALKLQLEERPTHVKVPLNAFHLDGYPDLQSTDDLTLKRLVSWLETEVAENLFISVQC